MDPRTKTLAKNLVNYSCELKQGEKVLIEVTGQSAMPLVKQIIRETKAVGAIPFVEIRDASVMREMIMNSTKDQMDFETKYDLPRMKEMDAYIGIRASENASEMSDVSSDDMQNYSKNYQKPVHNERVNNTKWVVLRYPNNAMAQLANTSLEDFEDFYYKVCNLDYAKMSMAMDNLVDLMEKTDKVRIVAVDTDLEFSIAHIPAIKCAGEANIPDGEVYTAPVKDSVNGNITYNTPAVYQGYTYENISFTFKDGKIIEATANNTEKINAVLDTDEGARFIGEFALGVNPYITKPMKDTLFDEKIAGSFHFTPGNAYDDSDNSNRSSVHWDLVLIQTEEYGGGEIYFDNRLIRKDGLFVVEELLGLNPENLK